MRLRIAALPLLLAAPLAGCFQSDVPLIAPGAEAFPALEISVAVAADAVSTFIQAEGRYVLITDDPAGMSARLMDLGEGLHLVELRSVAEGAGPRYAYAVVRFDAATGRVAVLRSLARPEDDLPLCAPLTACLDRPDPLIVLGRAAAAAGLEPEATFAVTLRE